MKKLSTRDTTYMIILIISSILFYIGLVLLDKDSYNGTYGIIAIGSATLYIVFYFLTLYLDKKIAFFTVLTSFVPIIVFILTTENSQSRGGTIFILITLVFFILIKSKEYYNVFFTKDYVSTREKKDQEKEKLRQEKLDKEKALKEKYNSKFRFDSNPTPLTPSEPVINLDKTKDIVFNDKTYTMNYTIKDDSNGMLLYLGTEMPDFSGVDGGEYFGDDDESSDVLELYGNHALIIESFRYYYYFDMNDLDSYTVDEYHDSEGYYYSNIIIKLKDGTTKEFGGYASFSDYIEDFNSFIKSDYPNVKLTNSYTYEKGNTFEISDKLVISGIDDYTKEVIILKEINYDDIESKEIKENGLVILHMKNGDLINLYMEEPIYNSLINKLNEINK